MRLPEKSVLGGVPSQGEEPEQRMGRGKS